MTQPKGRMRREPNPTPGKEPGFMAQYVKEGTANDPELELAEGKNGGIKTYDPDVLTRLNSLESKIDAIIDGSSPAHTKAQLTGSIVKEKYVVLANAVAITSTGLNAFNLIQQGLAESEIRQYKEFKINIINSHDQSAEVEVWTPVRSLGLNATSGNALLYKKANAISANTGRLVLQSKAGGTGATIDVIPALKGLFSNIIVGVRFPTAPTSGSVTIGVEMHG